MMRLLSFEAAPIKGTRLSEPHAAEMTLDTAAEGKVAQTWPPADELPSACKLPEPLEVGARPSLERIGWRAFVRSYTTPPTPHTLGAAYILSSVSMPRSARPVAVV